jgi:hypothetical protein
MPHPHRFDLRSAARLTACLALLTFAWACQSGAQEDDATSEVESLAAGNAAADAAGAAGGTAPSAGSPPAAAAANVVRPPASASPAEASASPAAPASTPTPAATSNAAAAPALAFQACTYSEGNYGRNCDSLYVTMKQVSPARCVQLTFDNCGEYGRGGLSVDVPMPWRLDSGAVSSNLDECELGVFYPNSDLALRASGSVTWSDATRLPSELVLDVTLETSTSAGAASVDVTTTMPLIPSVCDK